MHIYDIFSTIFYFNFSLSMCGLYYLLFLFCSNLFVLLFMQGLLQEPKYAINMVLLYGSDF